MIAISFTKEQWWLIESALENIGAVLPIEQQEELCKIRQEIAHTLTEEQERQDLLEDEDLLYWERQD